MRTEVTPPPLCPGPGGAVLGGHHVTGLGLVHQHPGDSGKIIGLDLPEWGGPESVDPAGLGVPPAVLVADGEAARAVAAVGCGV